MRSSSVYSDQKNAWKVIVLQLWFVPFHDYYGGDIKGWEPVTATCPAFGIPIH